MRTCSSALLLLLLGPYLTAQSSAGGDFRARNKAIVERYFHEVLDRKQFQLIRELYADIAVIEFPGRRPLKGPAAMEQAVRDALSRSSIFRTDILNLVAEGDMVIARIEHDARYEDGFAWRNRDGVTPAQLPMTRARWAAMTLFRIEAGKIVEQWISRDELGVLLQNGAVSVSPRR